MHEYELMYILRSDLDNEKADKLTARIDKLFTKHAGEKLLSEDLGEKNLAYTIKKERKGRYALLHFLGHGELVEDLEASLRITPEVLRFLTVCVDKNVDAAERKKAFANRPARKASDVASEETIAPSQ